MVPRPEKHGQCQAVQVETNSRTKSSDVDPRGDGVDVGFWRFGSQPVVRDSHDNHGGQTY